MENGKRWRILQREFFFLRLGTRLSWVLSLLMGEGEEKARLSPWLGPSPMLTSCLPQLPPASPAAAPLSLFVPSLSYSPLQTDRLAELLKLFLTLTMTLTLTSSLTYDQLPSKLALHHLALGTQQLTIQSTWLLEKHSAVLYLGDGLIWCVCPTSLHPLKSVSMLS